MMQARNSCFVADAKLQMTSSPRAGSDQQMKPDEAAGNQHQQPCPLPKPVVLSLTRVDACNPSLGDTEVSSPSTTVLTTSMLVVIASGAIQLHPARYHFFGGCLGALE